MTDGAEPLTLGTAGHIDHGKTALVRALTGVDTDRLAEEKRRGISIVLGYAPLRLPSGRRLSVVDVPGHERLVRTMVSGATGIDLFLMTIAADDGVMPQTTEHLRVLEALGIATGVVAVTKADHADPAPAMAAASRLLPGVAVVACSARTGGGVAEVAAALDEAAAGVASRALVPGPPILHIDRAFTVRGAGTVVTGTLWAGAVTRGDRLVLEPGDRAVRVRGVQVHDETVERAAAGQRVAVNLVGIERRAVARGDVLTAPGGGLRPAYLLDAALQLRDVKHGERVQVHHGTRETPARLARLDGELWQIRAEQPLLARTGDHVVVRRIGVPDTLGGGLVLDPGARKHAGRPEVLVRLERLRRGEPDPPPPRAAAHAEAAPAPRSLSDAALALERRLRAAGWEPPSAAELGDDAAPLLDELRRAGRAVRLGRAMYGHPEAVAEVRTRVEAIVENEGSITLGRLRDELHTSRRYAQALLEHLDAARVTRRLPDDSRVLRRSAASPAAREA